MPEKSIEEIMLASDLDDESESNTFHTDEENLCPRCGIANDDDVEECWSCQSPMKLPTLAQYGRTLSIGVVEEDRESGEIFELNKRFEMIPLTWPLERQVNRYWNKKASDILMGEYIGIILAYTVTRLGNVDMTQLKIPERLDQFNKTFMADVFHMYAYLRLLSLGNELTIRGIQCVDSNCGHRFNYTADVSSMALMTIEQPSQLESVMELPNGFEFGGSICNKLTLRPPTWSIMNDPNMGKSRSDTFEVSLINSVYKIEDLPRGAILTPKDIDRMTPPDIAFAKEYVDQMLYGPVWAVEGQCPKCGETFYYQLDWTFDDFFGRSFVSPRRRKRSKKSR